MAQKRFDNIINTIHDNIVLMSGKTEYFNSWSVSGNAEKSFSRRTKLSLDKVFWLVASRIAKSLPVALSSFFVQLGLPAPTKGAFSMKRRLVKSEFFEDVSKAVVRKLYSDAGGVKTWKGYIPTACDGSRVALPNIEELGEAFGYYHTYQGEPLYPCAKAAIFQDTLNNITILAKLVGKDVDERYTFEEHYPEANQLAGGKTIMLVDRGYFSYLLMYLMTRDEQLFVMKARKAPWRAEFIQSGKKEETVDILPSKSASIYSNSQWLEEKEKKIRVRLVRFDHPDGSADVLVTNIFDGRIASCQEVIELYRMRWPAETAYGVYKNDMALELFSSFRKDGILQDFYGALIMYNLASVIASDCRKPPKGKKINMNVAVGTIHILCPVFSDWDAKDKREKRVREAKAYLGHCLSESAPNRSFPRIRRQRKTSGKFYRQTNFSMAV